MDENFPERKPFDFGEMCRRNIVPAGHYDLSNIIEANNEPLAVFSMDRYLVTVARYSQFIDEGGYFDAECWSESGWEWRVENNIMAPRFWNEVEWRHLREPHDRPVVGVSWYEADAFCRFHGGALPTEMQWEAAARGPDGLRYPWGQDWLVGLVGNRGIGPRVCWQVGYWPNAQGPFGHHDLVANVWQWTSSAWPIKQAEELLVVRGGSWASREEMCRTNMRNGYLPSGQWSHVGFRSAYPLVQA